MAVNDLGMVDTPPPPIDIPRPPSGGQAPGSPQADAPPAAVPAPPPVSAPVPAPVSPTGAEPASLPDDPKTRGVGIASTMGFDTAANALAVAFGGGRLQSLVRASNNVDTNRLRTAQGIEPPAPSHTPAQLAQATPSVWGAEPATGTFTQPDTEKFLSTVPDPNTAMFTHAQTVLRGATSSRDIARVGGFLDAVAPQLLATPHWSTAAQGAAGQQLEQVKASVVGVELARFNAAVERGILSGASDGATRKALADWEALRSGTDLNPVQQQRLTGAMVALAKEVWWNDSPELHGSPLATLHKVNLDDQQAPSTTVRYTQFDAKPKLDASDFNMRAQVPFIADAAAMVDPMAQNIGSFLKRNVNFDNLVGTFDHTLTSQNAVDAARDKTPVPLDDAGFRVAMGANVSPGPWAATHGDTFAQAYRNAAITLGPVEVAPGQRRLLTPTEVQAVAAQAYRTKAGAIPSDAQSLTGPATQDPGINISDPSSYNYRFDKASLGTIKDQLAGAADRLPWMTLDAQNVTPKLSDVSKWYDEPTNVGVRDKTDEVHTLDVQHEADGSIRVLTPSVRRSVSLGGALANRTPALGDSRVTFPNAPWPIPDAQQIVDLTPTVPKYQIGVPDGNEQAFQRDGNAIVLTSNAARANNNQAAQAGLARLKAELGQHGIDAQLELPRQFVGVDKTAPQPQTVQQSGAFTFNSNEDLHKAHAYMTANADRIFSGQPTDIRAYVDGPASAPPGTTPVVEHRFVDQQGRMLVATTPVTNTWTSNNRVAYLPAADAAQLDTGFTKAMAPGGDLHGVEHWAQVTNPTDQYRATPGTNLFDRYETKDPDTQKWMRPASIAVAIPEGGAAPAIALNAPTVPGMDPARVVVVSPAGDGASVKHYTVTDGQGDPVYGRLAVELLRRIGVTGPMSLDTST